MPATPPPRPRASPSPSSLRSSTKPSRLTQTSLESDSITAPVPVPRPRSGQGFGTPQSSPTPRRALNVPTEVKSVPPPRPQGSPGSSRSGSFSKPYPVKPDLSPEAQSPELSTELKTRVQLFISCTNLVDRDILSKSDPICVVDLLQGSIDSSEGTYREVGRTEHIKNSLNPSFTRAIPVDYYFEEVQHLEFILYDVDSVSRNLRAEGGTVLGTVKTQLGTIIASGSVTLDLERHHGRKGKSGQIKIVAEEISNARDDVTIEMTWKATNLDKKDRFGMSDPFLIFSRTNADGTFTPVHRTEVVRNTLDPYWRTFTISSRQLCNSDPSRQIRVECEDWDNDGSTDFIGACSTTLGELQYATMPASLELVNKAKALKKKNYRNSGVAHLQEIKVHRKLSFFDFISNGCELNFAVGVDFTASNGDPNEPSSLHFVAPDHNYMNEYQRALWAVGSICQQYDTDKMFPAYGFGAKIPPAFQAEDMFNLDLSISQPECHGVEGILTAYESAVTQVQLWGPTNAAPIINTVVNVAEAEHRRIAPRKLPCTAYQILLMLTDGVITDMEATKQAIIRGSYLPMSVIIVGVGHANFKNMEVLDADDGLLQSQGRKALRDIVQFVPYSKYSSKRPELLARDVLAEVPSQLVDYMRHYDLPVNTPTY